MHHGNGTQKAFYKDNGVLFISIHQDKFYPSDMGFIEENGEGKGQGYSGFDERGVVVDVN